MSGSNRNINRQSTNYGSDIAYSDLVAVGLLSSQGASGSQSRQAQETIDLNFSNYGSEFDSDDEKLIDELFGALQSEQTEQSFAKEAAIQGSQPDDVVPFAKLPKSLSTVDPTKSAAVASVDFQEWNSNKSKTLESGLSHYNCKFVATWDHV
jgi:hypothetical protein